MFPRRRRSHGALRRAARTHRAARREPDARNRAPPRRDLACQTHTQTHARCFARRPRPATASVRFVAPRSPRSRPRGRGRSPTGCSTGSASTRASAARAATCGTRTCGTAKRSTCVSLSVSFLFFFVLVICVTTRHSSSPPSPSRVSSSPPASVVGRCRRRRRSPPPAAASSLPPRRRVLAYGCASPRVGRASVVVRSRSALTLAVLHPPPPRYCSPCAISSLLNIFLGLRRSVFLLLLPTGARPLAVRARAARRPRAHVHRGVQPDARRRLRVPRDVDQHGDVPERRRLLRLRRRAGHGPPF